jgi:hypothetical protein
MHEAYVAGGVDEIEKFFRARVIDSATLTAWQQIDAGRRSGDTTLVDRGNRTLLLREQLDIIDWFYLRMLRHDRPEGQIFTYLLTLAGVPSVPGAHSFPERYPRTFAAQLPGVAISVRTPLADGNIAVFADRWKLIDSDTLPDFLTFIHRHPEQARALVSVPVSSRAARYRLMRMSRLATSTLARWNVDIAPATTARPRLAIRSTERPSPPDDGDTRIDLTSPPTRDSLNIAADTDSRIWMNANQQPFDLALALPGGRVYRARAQKAVLISSTRGAAPDRLAVQLPSTGLDATEQTIIEYANDWRFPADAVDRWRAAAEHHASGDQEYSTHVFTADDVGFVHLEVQVSHHMHAGDFVVVTLFSWDNYVSAPSDASSPIAQRRHHEGHERQDPDR